MISAISSSPSSAPATITGRSSAPPPPPGFEARIVHPLASKQFRLPADPGNKTDDTDLAAIQRAAVNGFGLIEPVLDETHAQLRLLARHRRDLVRKNADLRNQIHAELDALLPGLSAAVGGIFDHEPALVIARQLGSAQEIRARGLDGLAALLRRRARAAISAAAWRRSWPGPSKPTRHRNARRFTSESSHIWMTSVAARLQAIRALESDLASLLVRTPYLLLLSFPGINVVSAAEFAGEMGPIANSPGDTAITGRAGLYPSRYQSDRVDHTGPLVRRANRALRYVILLIAENLLQVQRPLPRPGRGLAGGRGEPARRGGARRQAVLSDRLPDGGRSAGVPPPELPGAALHPRESCSFSIVNMKHRWNRSGVTCARRWTGSRRRSTPRKPNGSAAACRRPPAPRPRPRRPRPARPRDRRARTDVEPGRVRSVRSCPRSFSDWG